MRIKATTCDNPECTSLIADDDEPAYGWFEPAYGWFAVEIEDRRPGDPKQTFDFCSMKCIREGIQQAFEDAMYHHHVDADVVKNYDPELERLLAQEREIERHQR